MVAIKLPSKLAVSGYRFIKLGSSGEWLKRPIEIGWNIFDLEELDVYIKDRQKKWDEDELNGKHDDLMEKVGWIPKRPIFRGRLNNYAHDEPEFVEWLQKGNNYGVTSSGGLIKLESDDIERWRALGVLELLHDTFTVQSSSPNRQHFYYDGPEVADSPLKDPATCEDIGHIRGTGEAGGRGGMVVGPGSLHPHNVRYTVIKDLPIAKLTKDVLDKVKSILSVKSTQSDGNKHRETGKTDYKDPFKNVTISSVLGADYHDFNSEGPQMAGPNPYGMHTNKNGRCLVIEADDKEFYCFECEQGGGVSRLIAIRAGLMRCDEKGAPTGRLWWDTIRYALKEGIINEATAREAGLDHQEDRTAELLKAHELLKDLPEKIKADVNIIKEPAILKALAIIKEMDRIDYDLKLDSVKKANKALKVKSINATVEEHISNGAFDSEERKSPLEIVAERIPAWIEAHYFKTVADTERIYHYEHGVYLDDGEKVLKALIEAEFSDITTDAVVRDVIGKVKRRTYVDRDAFNNQHLLNVKNGLINLDTLELKPHTHDYLSTAQLEVTYNPEAKTPKIQTFLSEVAQSGDIELIKELIGWLLWPDYHIHKAIMLLGPGRNGKGTLLRLITAFLGGRNISNVTLQDLVSDRFAKADLYGKLANIGGDLPSKDLSDTAAFRNLTGGDDVRAQEKYKTAFGFRNKAKMLFSANVLPRSPDDTYAFYSRWILLEFLNLFTIENGTADPDLDAKLQTPEELSGLLNIALAGLKRLRENGWRFTYDKTVEDVEVMYKRNANPVFAFLIDECEPGEATDYIEKTVFYNRFKAYAESHGLRPLSVTKFGELLKDQTEIPVASFRPWIEHGERPRCWQGVKFQSIPSIVKPTPSLAWGKGIREEIDEEKKEVCSIVGLKQTLDGMDCEIKADLKQAGEQVKSKVRWTDDQLKPEKKRKQCLMCGKDPEGHSFIQYYNNGVSGWLCTSCSMGQTTTTEPVKPDSQTTLNAEADAEADEEAKT